MLTPRLDRIYAQFEDIIAVDRSGYGFENARGGTSVDLPHDYRVFVNAERRFLPNNWEFFSYFGHQLRAFDDVRAELLAEGLSERWLVFGQTAGDDFLVFDTYPARYGAVLWPSADAIHEIATEEPYARNFAEMIIKVARAEALKKLELAQRVLAELPTPTA